MSQFLSIFYFPRCYDITSPHPPFSPVAARCRPPFPAAAFSPALSDAYFFNLPPFHFFSTGFYFPILPLF